MSHELVSLDFEGQMIAAYLIDGHRHALTDEQVGTLLGYADPARSISNLVQRDEHRELDGLSTVIKLMTVESGRTVTRSRRIWGREGVIAIGFLCGTEKGAWLREIGRKALIDKADQISAAIKSPAIKPAAQMREAFGLFTATLKFAKALGLDGNRATIKAIQITREQTGVDAVAMFEVAGFIAETQEPRLTPTQIGETFSPIKTAQTINNLLAEMGFQTKIDGKWVGAPEHKDLWVMTEAPRLHTVGSALALRWYPGVVDRIKAKLTA